jgi:hypothetical protein
MNILYPISQSLDTSFEVSVPIPAPILNRKAVFKKWFILPFYIVSFFKEKIDFIKSIVNVNKKTVKIRYQKQTYTVSVRLRFRFR